MSRFFKSAAFPILIVVVLAFFAQKLIGNSSHSPQQLVRQPAHAAAGQRQVKGLTLNEKDNTANVTLLQQYGGTKYTVGYPDQLRADS